MYFVHDNPFQLTLPKSCFRNFFKSICLFLFLDVNECRILGTCSQLCTNKKGSYKCSCLPGYQLEGKRHCKALGRTVCMFFLKIIP